MPRTVMVISVPTPRVSGVLVGVGPSLANALSRPRAVCTYQGGTISDWSRRQSVAGLGDPEHKYPTVDVIEDR